MGRLERHLDVDLIERMEAGWAPPSKEARADEAERRKVNAPRLGKTYRPTRRNWALRDLKTVWKGARPKGPPYHPPVRMNRSRKWDGVPTARPYR